MVKIKFGKQTPQVAAYCLINSLNIASFKCGLYITIGRNFIVKYSEKFFEHNAKSFAWKFLTVTEELPQNWNDFTQLWRQWPCLLKSKSI